MPKKVPVEFVMSAQGPGSGRVHLMPGDETFSMGDIVRRTFPQGTVISLSESHGPDVNFTGWTGPCSGFDATCTFTLSERAYVTLGWLQTGAATT